MDASGKPTLTQALSPTEQQKYDLSSKAAISGLGILNEAIPNIRDQLLQPFGLSGGVQSGLGSSPGNIQMGVDFSKAPPIPKASFDLQKAVANAMYQQGARFLDPQFQQAQTALDAQLANQGITANATANPNDQTSAWQKMQTNLANQRAQSYGNLANLSTMSGTDAMNTLFGMGAQAHQMGVSDILNTGQFANTAQQQNFGELLAQWQQANAARQQAYGEYASNRTMPFNMMASLLGAGQVNNPQFQATQNATWNPTPWLQGAQLQGQASAAQNSAKSGLTGQGIGALGGLGAAYLRGPFGPFG